MNERLSDFAAAPASYWFDLERRLDAILRRSQARLDALASDANVQALRRSLDGGRSFDDAPVSYSLELGRVRLTADELATLGPESIVPLSDVPNGGAVVQIWADGRLQGRGVLLVVDGKLAVRVEEIAAR
ncbi:MAG: FliM/FliN family flagellar motor switch protein [Thermoguttaceae bacterium]|nr:FliM/FliN family flagellar motor switch protein [Thermoguttaceae bacterium]